MNIEFAKFANFLDSARDPNAPHLSLELRASPMLRLSTPFEIYVTLRYHPSPGNASKILVQWRPFRSIASNIPLVFLEETEQGLRMVENDEKVDAPWEDETVGRFSHAIFPLSNSEPEAKWNEPLPGRRHKSLELGKEYIAFWPGGEVKWWDWGTLADHEGRIINATETAKDLRPSIIIPASNSIRFAVGEEPFPWPERAAMERRMPSIDCIDIINFAESIWRQRLNQPRGPILD